jgi:hypothetical protein
MKAGKSNGNLWTSFYRCLLNFPPGDGGVVTMTTDKNVSGFRNCGYKYKIYMKELLAREKRDTRWIRSTEPRIFFFNLGVRRQ